MRRIQTICSIAVLAGVLTAVAAPIDIAEGLKKLPLSALEQRIEAIDAELSQLAHPSLRSGIGSLGYRSKHAPADTPQWIEIEWSRAVPIDQILLAPILWRDSETGFRADGFPSKFRITTGTTDDRTGTVLGEYNSADGGLPRVAPWILPANGIIASWLRIDIIHATQLTLFPETGYQLSEIMVFSGEENIALRSPVKVASPSPPYARPVWNKQFLTDGLMPYRMDSGRGERSTAYYSNHVKSPYLSIDLGKPMPISQLQLHAMDQGNTAPLAIPVNLGFPKLLQVEGANHPDFSDATPLLEIRYHEAHEIGPVMMWNLPETTCRYVRITAPTGDDEIRVGFTEIELLSNGRNVAKGKTIETNHIRAPRDIQRSLSTLTDGLNFYGVILPVRTWMDELARRHELETTRPLVAAELNRRYTRQKANLNRMYWFAALLIVAVAFSLLIERNIHARHIIQIKERFAADLHDELGANLHTIGLLNQLIRKKAADLPKDISQFLQRIETVTTRSSLSVRHMSEMQTGNRLSTNLADDLQRSAVRIIVDHKHELSIEGETYLSRLKPRTQTDLLLFHKECLINICRHAGASKISTRLVANKREVRLTVTDNGHGLPESAKSNIPSSLKRRAKLLKAKLTVNDDATAGTCIDLKLRRRRWWI